MSMIRCDTCASLIDTDENPDAYCGEFDVWSCEACASREPRCTCLRRDPRYMDSPYDTPGILRRDSECEVHGRDPDRERDARRDEGP